jgi:hypothetical protein
MRHKHDETGPTELFRSVVLDSPAVGFNERTCDRQTDPGAGGERIKAVGATLVAIPYDLLVPLWYAGAAVVYLENDT